MTSFQPPFEQRFQADFAGLLQRMTDVETRLTAAVGAYAAIPCTSSARPANPVVGCQILETDTGLTAIWSGTTWVYAGMQLLHRTVLGAPAATVRLPGSGSFPQVFTTLQVVISASGTSTVSAGYDAASMQVNGVTSGSYTWQSHYVTQGAGSVSAFGVVSATSAQIAEIWNAHYGSAGQGIATITIPDYASTSKLKSWTSLSTAIDGGTVSILQTYAGGLTGTTAAVTSLTAIMAVGNFTAGSSFSVYGIG